MESKNLAAKGTRPNMLADGGGERRQHATELMETAVRLISISCKNYNKNVYDIMATASAFVAVAVSCRFLLNFDTRTIRHASSGCLNAFHNVFNGIVRNTYTVPWRVRALYTRPERKKPSTPCARQLRTGERKQSEWGQMDFGHIFAERNKSFRNSAASSMRKCESCARKMSHDGAIGWLEWRRDHDHDL